MSNTCLLTTVENSHSYNIQHSFTESELQEAAHRERVTVEFLKEALSKGLLIIPRNINHKHARPTPIGLGVTTKVNANIGTSAFLKDVKEELHKLEVAIRAGADTVMDLSTGGDLKAIRQEILDASPVPVGTVPVYEVGRRMIGKKGGFTSAPVSLFLEVVEEQAEQGVDYFTIHAGVTQKNLEVIERVPRITGIVSRGGGMMAAWMRANGRENPYYEYFDELTDILARYCVTYSLGDGLRPGSIHDASDEVQFSELFVIGELTKRAWEKGVQVMIEGPGHVPLNQIEMNVRLQKRVCHGAPFYVLGPLVCDIAPGYDHITGAMGAMLAGAAGADLLCYVTPAEHLALPDARDVHEGVIAFKIAAHAADIAKGLDWVREWDDELSRARKEFRWDDQIRLAIDPVRARQYRERDKVPLTYEGCTMCGEFCPMREDEKSRKIRLQAPSPAEVQEEEAYYL